MKSRQHPAIVLIITLWVCAVFTLVWLALETDAKPKPDKPPVTIRSAEEREVWTATYAGCLASDNYMHSTFWKCPSRADKAILEYRKRKAY